MAKIRAALKAAREAAGLKQYQLAAKLGITAPVLSEIETGRRGLSDELKAQIAGILGRTVQELFPGET